MPVNRSTHERWSGSRVSAAAIRGPVSQISTLTGRSPRPAVPRCVRPLRLPSPAAIPNHAGGHGRSPTGRRRRRGSATAAGHLVVGDLLGQPNQLAALHAHTTSLDPGAILPATTATLARAASTAAKYSSANDAERCDAALSPGGRGRLRLRNNPPAQSSGRRGAGSSPRPRIRNPKQDWEAGRARGTRCRLIGKVTITSARAI